MSLALTTISPAFTPNSFNKVSLVAAENTVSVDEICKVLDVYPSFTPAKLNAATIPVLPISLISFASKSAEKTPVSSL